MKWAVVYSETPPKERDCIVLPLFTDEIDRWDPGPFGFAGEHACRALETGDFRAKHGEIHVTYPEEGVGRFVLLGLGERDDLGSTELAAAFDGLGGRVLDMGLKSVTILMPEGIMEHTPHPVRLVIDGLSRGSYRFDRYLKERKRSKLKGVMILLPTEDRLKEGLADARVGQAIAEARRLMMDLVNEPPNVATPDHTARQIRSWFKDGDGSVKVKVMKPAALEKLGLNLVLAVGAGSANKPRMVVIEYRGGRARQRPVVLVGKGVTFDGGGLSIKTAEGMRKMKEDMSGAAAVAATIKAASALGLRVNIIGITPLVENVIGPSAYKVSDVIRSYSGRTVEVLNTDAEGRLILADALAYAVDMKPSQVIDIATLTGAAIVALGREAAAVMGNDREVLDRLREAAEVSGERVWEMPMWKAYDHLVRSKIADVRNVGEKRDAGSIVGGKFLERFVGNTPWTHIDIAPTFSDEDGFSTGYGVALLLTYLMLLDR